MILIFPHLYSGVHRLLCSSASFRSFRPLPTSRSSCLARLQEVEDFLSRFQQLCPGAYLDVYLAEETTRFVCRVSHASFLTHRSERYVLKIVSQEATAYEHHLAQA
jgi:hypothetical protein